jgi:hypothetical protein
MGWPASAALGYALLVVLASGLHGASALDLSVTARAEAGLDPATREFIATLPDTWRPQIAKIVDDTMRRVDMSFKEYVQQVDRLISDKLIEAQCLAVSTSDQIVQNIVKQFPWVSEAGAVEKLGEQTARTDARRHSNSTPTFIKHIYDDLMIGATYVSCQTGSVPEARSDIKKILDNYRAKWLVWNRVESLKCTSSIDCLPIYKTTINTIIDSSDERDLVGSKARAIFQAIDIPKQAAGLFAPEIEFNKIEDMAMQLYELENAIGGAKAVREAKAIDLLNRAKQGIQDAKNKIDQQRKLADAFQRAFPCYKFGYARMRPLKQQPLTEAIQWLHDSAAMAPLLKEEVDPQLVLANTQFKRTTDIVEFCK